jgi:Ser-tRNA(Ala) deacylase AlaX
LKLTISYLTHDLVHEALGYIPEFVEFAEIVRWIKLRDNDIGFPCNGTHTTEVNHINITNIVTN